MAQPHYVTDKNLAGSRFSNVNMAGTTFDNVNLSGATLHNINLRGAHYRYGIGRNEHQRRSGDRGEPGMEIQPNRAAFERVREQIGFCGIWCGSCAVGNGCVGEFGKGLRDLLVAYDAPGFAAIGIGWEPLLDALGSLGQTVSCPGCHRGGGRTDCEIRACARRHRLDHCTECASFGAGGCEHSTILEHMRSGAVKVGLSVLRPGESKREAMAAWTRADSRPGNGE